MDRNNITNKDYESELHLPQSIAERHIGIRMYLGDGVFLLENGDLGIVYECQGIFDMPLTVDVLESRLTPFESFIRSLICGIPSHHDNSGTIVQLICSQRPVDDHIDSEDIYPSNLAGKILKQEEKHLFSMNPIYRKFLICVRWTPSPSSGLLDSCKQMLKDVVSRQKDIHKTSFARKIFLNKSFFLTQLQSKLTESGLPLIKIWDDIDLINYYNNVFNFASPINYSLNDSNYFETIENQIITPPIRGEYDGLYENLNDSNRNIKLFTITALPDKFSLGRIRMFMDSIPITSWDLTLTLSGGKRGATAYHMTKMFFFANGPANVPKMENLQFFADNISASNPQTLTSLRLVTYNTDSASESLILDKSVKYLYVPLHIEDRIAPHMITTSLPLNCNRQAHKIPGRYRTLLLKRSLNFAPLYDGKPNTDGYRYFLTTGGFPVKFDIFDGSHISILGKSGAGKSVLNSQVLILEFLWRFPNGIIRVIDKKTSYEKICHLLGGKLIQFSEDYLKGNTFSPFSLSEWDTDAVNDVVLFLSSSMAILNPQAEISGVHTSILKEAIVRCIRDHKLNVEYSLEQGSVPPKHFTWIDVKSQLLPAAEAIDVKNSRVYIDQITEWTLSFNPNGQYGYIFSAIENNKSISSDSRLIVYDLDGISDKKLLNIVSQLSFLQINRSLMKLDTSIRKLIVVEELGVLLNSDSIESDKRSDEFVRNVTKTARKLNAQAVGISNEATDFTESSGGRSFWGLSNTKIFLPATRAIVAAIREHFSKQFDDGDFSVISSLELVKGSYTEAYIYSEKSSGEKYQIPIVLPLSNSLDAITTTSGPQLSLYRKIFKENLNDGLEINEASLKAIEYMIAHHPMGIGLE